MTYLASADYDARDARSITAAEIKGPPAGLAVPRRHPHSARLPEQAYLVTTGPDFGTRESRHLDAVRPLTWTEVGERSRASRTRVALGTWGVEWHDRETYGSSFINPPSGRDLRHPASPA